MTVGLGENRAESEQNKKDEDCWWEEGVEFKIVIRMSLSQKMIFEWDLQEMRVSAWQISEE